MNKFLTALLLLSLTVTAGCHVRSVERAQSSGFLGDAAEYEKMTADGGFRNNAAYTWWDPNIDYSRYKRVFIQPLQVRFVDALNEQSADPKAIENLRNAFMEAVTSVLAEKGQLANSPNEPDVVVLSSCITHLKVPNVKRNVGLNIVSSWIPGASFFFASEGEVAIESLFTDGMSGKRIATFMDSKIGESTGVRHFLLDSYTEWGHIKSAFLTWSKSLSASLESQKGKK